MHACQLVHKEESLTVCTEIERFIDVNTQQLSESKYLCPLSGKKFKAAEFVRKHIFNKHGDKIDDVRLEVWGRLCQVLQNVIQ